MSVSSLFFSIVYAFERHKKIIVAIFFGAIVVLGFFIYKDYGLAWDEPISHANGQVSFNYITKSDPTLWTYSERFYGVLVELPFAWLQRTFDVSSPQMIFFMRHILTYLLFVVGVWVFYLFLRRRFDHWWLALLGAGLLVMSPRIFADAFYNSKDIPLMIAFIIGMHTLSRLLERFSWQRMVLHALATAAVIAIRVPGIFIIAITVAMVVLDSLIAHSTRAQWQRRLGMLLGYGALTILFTIALWPFLWQHPLAHFREAFADMSHFSRQIDMQVLYMGEFVKASALPWHYIPVWMLITTPPLYLALFFVGVWTVARKIFSIRRVWSSPVRMDVAALAWLFGPIIAVIIFHSVLYDGWRHLYFIYPALLFLALVGIEHILAWVRTKDEELRLLYRWLAGIALGIGLLSTAWFMVRNHPYQNVYFNFLAGGMKSARDNFDLDYWGLSFRKGLEYVAARDTDSTIPVYLPGGSPDNLYILDPQVAGRFVLLSQKDSGKAKYVISNYRWQRYKDLPKEIEVYTVDAGGASILSVYKVR